MSATPPGAAVRLIHSEGLATWLQQQALSLAFTTYQTNRLFCLGLSTAGTVQAHERLLDKPKGLFAQGQSLFLSSRYQIWQFRDLLAPGETRQGCDRLFFPKHSHTTGDLNVHDVVLDSDGNLLFVNTDFSCLARLSDRHSFEPLWQPPFINKLASEDRCHLNGLALKDGQPATMTACSSTNTAAGWRANRRDGGVVIDIASGEIIARGLSMPHSPRWYQGRLWLLNSGTGELGWIDLDTGAFQPLCFCPGFVRGLAFCGNQAIVGLSKLRARSFSGLQLEERLAAAGLEAQCGLLVIDLTSGQVDQWLRFEGVVEELFDVVVLPGVRQPQVIGFQSEDIERLVSFPCSGGVVVTKPTVARPGHSRELPVPGLPRQLWDPGAASEPQPGQPPAAAPPEATPALKYQRVFHLTPEGLRSYEPFTFPSLQARWASQPQRGELVGTSASLQGEMVAFAIAECLPSRRAELISLFVAPEHRRRGVGGRLVSLLEQTVRQEGCTALIRPQPADSASSVPQQLRALFSKARAFQQQGDLPEAIEAYQAVLQHDPNLAAAHCNLGAIYQLQGDGEAALAAYQAALAAKPSFAIAHLNLGRLLLIQRRWPEAEAALRRVVDLQPSSATAHLELATAQRLLGDTAAAIASCEAALVRQPELYEAWHNLGGIWMQQGEMGKARHCFEQVLQRQPDHIAAHQVLGHVQEATGEPEAALASYARALELDPAATTTFVQREFLRLSLADWPPHGEQHIAELRERIETLLEDPDAHSPLPLTVLRLPLPPALNTAVARRWAKRIAAGISPLRPPSGFPAPPPAHRLHLGYLSADFRQHPVGTLIHQIFQHHDRNRFHVTAYALVAADDAYTASVREGCDAFVDLSALSPLAAAERIHADGIHILIDLAGYTTSSRPEILALQPAPVQIHYLGYPGSLGADFIPYLLADPWLIPAHQRQHYSEQVIDLPHAFVGSELEISPDAIQRQEFGLPVEAFVFCCFNRSYKIEPAVFTAWMAILSAVPDSVLWLKQSPPTVQTRLRQKVAAQGIDPARLLFSPHLPMERYLATYRLADLFLDTFAYNSGSTAVHALWAGLPVLTCPGNTFASRMGASICAAAGLPSLICADPAAYEARAIALATTDRSELRTMRRHLIEQRDQLPLFDRKGWVRNLESALCQLWESNDRMECSGGTSATRSVA
ncbi:MAG: TIGR03032 family protein [Cyanobium sp. CZS 48M]|nr:TIGR03032 family protein [Cyanobium sp. CZS48M]